MKTAEEFFKENTKLRNNKVVDDVTSIMIEFAKYHVEQALKKASENAFINDLDYDNRIVDKNSILNAYPLENIK